MLPLSEAPAEISGNTMEKNVLKGGGTVLLVDDDEVVRDIGTEMLSESGFETITV
jgi:hypothetical protein